MGVRASRGAGPEHVFSQSAHQPVCCCGVSRACTTCTAPGDWCWAPHQHFPQIPLLHSRCHHAPLAAPLAALPAPAGATACWPAGSSARSHAAQLHASPPQHPRVARAPARQVRVRTALQRRRCSFPAEAEGHIWLHRWPQAAPPPLAALATGGHTGRPRLRAVAHAGVRDRGVACVGLCRFLRE